MEKFFPRAEERVPLEMLVNGIVKDLLVVFVGNKYKNIAFTLTATDLDVEDSTVCAGNLRVDGIKEQLQSVLDAIERREAEDAKDSNRGTTEI